MNTSGELLVTFNSGAGFDNGRSGGSFTKLRHQQVLQIRNSERLTWWGVLISNTDEEDSNQDREEDLEPVMSFDGVHGGGW